MLPLPYGTGAGYIFSAALLKWVATSPAIAGWVREARGADHERLQWQKYEDTSTGYWVREAAQPRRTVAGEGRAGGRGGLRVRCRPALELPPRPYPLAVAQTLCWRYVLRSPLVPPF